VVNPLLVFAKTLFCVKISKGRQWCFFPASESCTTKNAEQSVHLTGGILRHFRAFSTPEQNPALKVLSTPAHPQVTQAVGRWLIKKEYARRFS